MAVPQAVWGIDIGRTALKAIKLKLTGDGSVEAVANDFIEHAAVLSQPDVDRNELISSSLEKFLSRNDISKDGVVVSVPGQHTLARFTKLPPVAPKRLPDIVRYEADQQIPFEMDEVIWDYQTFEQEGLPDIEVGIFAMKRELLREHLLYFEQAAIEPVAVQSSPLAVYNLAHFEGLLSENTTVLLDVGSDNTDLIIGTPNSLWSRTIPIGGNNFTEALVKSFKLSFSKAESLKRGAETSKYRRQIFQAMRPTLSDLVQELQRSIGFYSSTHRDAEVDKIVGYGNAFKLPGLQKYLQQNLELQIDIPSSFNQISITGADSNTLKEQMPSFGVACGLALQGLDKTKVTSNLLPTEIAKQIVWRKKRSAFAAAAACLVMAGALIWFRQTTDMSALAAGAEAAKAVRVSETEAPRIINNGPRSSLPDRAQAQTVVEAGKFLKDKLNQLRSQGQDERNKTSILVQHQRNKTVVLDVLKVVHDSIPQMSESMAHADCQDDVVKAVEAAGSPRGERKQLFVESFDVQYMEDLNVYEWSSLVEVEPAINDPEAEVPGFKLTIKCRTPHQDGAKFISESFMDSLRANGREPDKGFYFDRVVLFEGGKVGALAAEASGGFAGRRANSKVPMDPVTNENTEDDWQFEIWADVILEDYPEAEEDEDVAESEEE